MISRRQPSEIHKLNPRGVPAQSPGLRGTSYPGTRIAGQQPQPGCGWLGQSRHNPVGAENHSDKDPVWLVPRNPGLEDTIPLRLKRRRFVECFIGLVVGFDFPHSITVSDQVPLPPHGHRAKSSWDAAREMTRETRTSVRAATISAMARVSSLR